MGAVGAAKKRATRFDAVTDNFAAAVVALRSQSVNGAFKRIKVSGNAVDDDLQIFVVFVSANLASVHNFNDSAIQPTYAEAGNLQEGRRPYSKAVNTVF